MNANSRSDCSDDSLFGSSSSAQPEKKRRKLNDDNDDESAASKPKAVSSSSSVDPVLMKHAKSRLSKFAARLFDPNRIKVRTHRSSLCLYFGGALSCCIELSLSNIHKRKITHSPLLAIRDWSKRQ